MTEHREQLLSDIVMALADGWERSSELLHLALGQRDGPLLHALLQTKLLSDINVPFGDQGWTPLHTAVHQDAFEAATLLLQFGADPLVCDYDGVPAVCYAVIWGRADILRHILEARPHAGAARTANGQTLGHLAALSFPITIVVVKSSVCPLALYNASGKTAAHLAMDGQMFMVVKELVGRDETLAHLPCRADGRTLLHMASACGEPDIIAFLLRVCGVPANVTDDTQRTPLHYAVQAMCPEAIRHLISYGACADVRDRSGLSPLDLAVRTGDSCLVAAVLRAAGGLIDAHATVSIAAKYVTCDAVRGVLHRAMCNLHDAAALAAAPVAIAALGKALTHIDIDVHTAASLAEEIRGHSTATLHGLALHAMCVVLTDTPDAIRCALHAVTCDAWDPRGYDVLARLFQGVGCDALSAEVFGVRDRLLGAGPPLRESFSPAPLNDLEIEPANSVESLDDVVNDKGTLLLSVLMPGGCPMWLYVPCDSVDGVGVLKGPIACGYPIPSGQLVMFRGRKFVEVVTSDTFHLSVSNVLLRRVHNFPIDVRSLLSERWESFVQSNSNRQEMCKLLSVHCGETLWVVIVDEGAFLDADTFVGVVFYPPQFTNAVVKGQRVLVNRSTGCFLYAFPE